jgi:hypothetical protein
MSNEIANNVVAGSNLVSFLSGFSRQEKSDVLKVLRFADYFASATWRRQDAWLSWMMYYRAQLQKYGCKPGAQVFMDPIVVTEPAELDRIVYTIKGLSGVDRLVEEVARGFRSMRINEYARVFFQQGRGEGTLSTFQSVPCERNSAGQIQILMIGVHANAYASSDIFGLTEITKRDMVVRLTGGIYTFDAEAFAPHRDYLRSRLQGNARLAIQNLRF